MSRTKILISVALLLTSAFGWSEPAPDAAAAAPTRSGVVIQAAPLLAAPTKDAATVAQLGKDDHLQIRGRKGAWYEVETAAGATGFVKMLAVRFDKSATAGSADTSKLVGDVIGLGGTTGAEATAVRGMDDDNDSGSAAPVAAGPPLEQLKANESTVEDATEFARKAGLLKSN